MRKPSRDHAAGPALWECPRCGRTFANVNQTHTCAALGDLDRHFAASEPAVRATFDRVRSTVEGLGPVSVLPEKSRIAFHVRMSFAAFMPRRTWLDGHLVLARRIDSPRFRRIEVYSPRNILHAFRLTAPAEVDSEFAAWLAEAYEVGEQRHLGRRDDRQSKGIAVGETIRFKGQIRRWQEDAPGGLAVVDIPAVDVPTVGGRRQMRVSGTLDGHPFTGSTMLVAGGGFCVGISQAAMRGAGVQVGDEVALELSPPEARPAKTAD